MGKHKDSNEIIKSGAEDCDGRCELRFTEKKRERSALDGGYCPTSIHK
jgi:hypothetical protein